MLGGASVFMLNPQFIKAPLCLPMPNSGEVHVWVFVQTVYGHLSGGEQARADRFINQVAREAFLKGRSGLREACSRYLGIAPGDVEIGISDEGKPYLGNADSLHFNLSHCGSQVVAAFASEEIGIDLESPARCEDFHGIAKRFFCPSESLQIEESGARGRDVFFRMWTAKEAMLKLCGAGIAGGLEAAVTNGPQGARLDGRPVCVEHFGLDERVGAIASFLPFEVNVWLDL